MSKNIVGFDVETTGLDFKKDYIIQLSAVKFDSEFNIVDKMDYIVKPICDFEIAEGALEKHGITKEQVLTEGHDLKTIANKFIEFTDGCDMLSYNGNSFDIRMITKDFRSVGVEFEVTNRVFFDSLLLETKLNPRNLETVYKRYTGKTLENAHNALYDVEATIEIFKHQVAAYANQDITLDDIMQFDESKIFCIDGMIKKSGDDIVFAKGKYRDIEFMEVARKDVGYIKWFMSNPEFDITTKVTLRQYYADRKNK